MADGRLCLKLCSVPSLFRTLHHSCAIHTLRNEFLSRAAVRKSSTTAPEDVGGSNTTDTHINAAAMEKGATMYFNNRNPRSLELLGMAEKPRGWATRNKRVDYYHRLMLDISTRHVSAYVDHNTGTKVVEASTKEFCISRHLYKTCDVAAAFNIGRVIALRCREMGLNRVMWEHKWDRKHKKVIAFIKGLKEGGLILNEPKPRNRLPPPGTLPRY